MKVFGWASNKQSWSKPFPAKSKGLYLSFRGGDVIRPYGSGNWFAEPFYRTYWRWHCKYAVLPFFSCRWGRYGMYIGAKCFGVDHEAYKNWLPPEEVYDGSRALALSFRFSTTVQDG